MFPTFSQKGQQPGQQNDVRNVMVIDPKAIIQTLPKVPKTKIDPEHSKFSAYVPYIIGYTKV